MRIFVGNLARDVTEAELQQAFAEFGQVSSVAIPKDRETGEPRGFGFVEMPADAEAKRALAGLSGRALKGRALRVDEARPRDERAPREGRAPTGGRSRGVDGRGAEREFARPPARSMGRGADRAAERNDSRRPTRGDRDAWGDSRRSSSDEWSPPLVPFGDDWSSPPRGVDDEGQSARGNRNSRATGKRGRDDPDGDNRPGKAGRSGGRSSRGHRNRHEDDEDLW
jgi:RNA recognition motif-containing protein